MSKDEASDYLLQCPGMLTITAKQSSRGSLKQGIDTITISTPGGDPFVIGVVADTHIPDRSPQLPRGLLPSLKEAKVALILHAGDISVPSVLETLKQVAPVVAVRGNRDILMRKALPLVVSIRIGGTEIGLTHGHGSLGRYLVDKIRHLRNGYRIEDYRGYLRDLFPEAQAIVFGHTHHPEARVDPDGVLLFNPGAASKPFFPGTYPSYGLLTIAHDGRVKGHIIPLRD